MILVGLIALGLWFGGRAMGASPQARWLMIALLFVLVLALQIALPDGHPMRAATGGTPELWFLLAGIAAVIYGYRALLMRLRARAGTEVPIEAPRTETFSTTELERYARHIVLREIGGPGQKKLRDAKVLVIGAGGLGAPALLYLGAAGVGTLGVIDDDTVENANLQRQIVHRDRAIGMPKAFSAQETARALNPSVDVRPYNRRLTEEISHDLIADYDVVLDGSDSFATRDLVNRACVETGRPLVSGALSQWEGQISVFDPEAGAPCYACIFPSAPADGLQPNCAEGGVLGPLPGVIGAMMAVETVKLISGAGQPLRGHMLIYDALDGQTRRIALSRRPDCPVCRAKAA